MPLLLREPERAQVPCGRWEGRAIGPGIGHQHLIRRARGVDYGSIGEPPTPEVTVEAAYHTLDVCFAFLESAADGEAKVL